MFKDVAKIIRKAYMDIDKSIRIDDIINIAVSYDGSWQKRGHSSQYGVGTIIELETGLILDYEAYSLYCHVGCNNFSIIYIYIYVCILNCNNRVAAAISLVWSRQNLIYGMPIISQIVESILIRIRELWR